MVIHYCWLLGAFWIHPSQEEGLWLLEPLLYLLLRRTVCCDWEGGRGPGARVIMLSRPQGSATIRLSINSTCEAQSWKVWNSSLARLPGPRKWGRVGRVASTDSTPPDSFTKRWGRNSYYYFLFIFFELSSLSDFPLLQWAPNVFHSRLKPSNAEKDSIKSQI